jgi:hypothetical protein
LVVNSGTGAGFAYRISGNTAASSAGVVKVFLAQPEGLTAAIAASSATKVSLVASPFSALVTSTSAARAAGVTSATIAANAFGWFQTAGYCSVQSDAAPATKGQALKQSVTTAGNVTATAAATDIAVGSAVETGVSTEYRLAYLSID